MRHVHQRAQGNAHIDLLREDGLRRLHNGQLTARRRAAHRVGQTANAELRGAEAAQIRIHERQRVGRPQERRTVAVGLVNLRQLALLNVRAADDQADAAGVDVAESRLGPRFVEHDQGGLRGE